MSHLSYYFAVTRKSNNSLLGSYQQYGKITSFTN